MAFSIALFNGLPICINFIVSFFNHMDLNDASFSGFLDLTGECCLKCFYCCEYRHYFIPTTIFHLQEEYIIANIADYAFTQNFVLKELTFHKNCDIKYIGDLAFWSSNIRKIHFRNLPISPRHFYTSTGKKIEFSLLDNKSIYFVENDRTIYYRKMPVIFQCNPISSKKSIRVRNSIKIIGERCFAYSSINTIFICDSILIIGKEAFLGSIFKRIVFSNMSLLAKLQKRCFEKAHFAVIVFPPSLKIIEDRSFYCSDLKRVIWPQNSQCTSIGLKAFELTLIISLHFPKSLQIINYHAFNSCYRLQSVVFPIDSHIQMISNAFFSCYSINQLICSGPTVDICKNDPSLLRLFK